MNLKSLRATTVLIGTIIGAGIFGIPYAIASAGVLVGFVWLIFLTGVVLILNLAYTEVILRTPGDHQLVGYAKIYFGQLGKVFGLLAHVVGLYGALLAYVIQAGVFLALIANQPTGNLFYSTLFFFLGSLAVFFGLRAISGIELVFVFLLVFLLILLSYFGLPFWLASNFLSKLFDFSFVNWVFPYGVILFALTGMGVIPEIEEILRDQHTSLPKVVMVGTLLPALIYLFFSIVILGVSGQNTSTDAISGLLPLLNPVIVKVGAVLGVVAMSTSFLTLGFALREVYFRDLNFPRNTAWALAVFPPLALFLAGAQSFIKVIGITGSITGGLSGILVMALFVQARKKGKLSPEFILWLPNGFVVFIALVFLLGIFYQLWQFVQ